MQRTITARGADALTINTGSVNVQIAVEDLLKDVVVVLDAAGHQFEEAAELATLVDDELIVPTVTGPISSDDDAPTGLMATIRIPRDVGVTATNGVGEITVRGPLANSHLHTSGGCIWLDKAGGTTVVAASSGINGINDSSGILHATTSGGHIAVRRVSGVAVLHTSGGDILARGDDPTMLDAVAFGGNVQISGRYDRKVVTASAFGGRVRYLN